jgi:hypothetical protein
MQAEFVPRAQRDHKRPASRTSNSGDCKWGTFWPAIDGDTRPFNLAKKELNFKKSKIYREVDHVGFKVAGLAYRYDDASLDGLRSLSSRLCKCCQVLCAVKRGNSRRTP